MRLALAVLFALFVTTPALAEDKPKPNTLTAKEIADGWLMLFDGETTFGWKTEGDVKVDNGVLVINGTKGGKARTNVAFPIPSEIIAEWKWSGGDGATLGLGETGSSVRPEKE